jgi:hypothetical protein
VRLYQEHASVDTVSLIVNKSRPWVAKQIKFAMNVWHQARDLFDQGYCEDIVSRRKALHAYPRPQTPSHGDYGAPAAYANAVPARVLS